MAYEMLVALNVVDEEGYTAYRHGMTPILEQYGGSFPYDFKIATTLKSEASHPLNRVFVIRFADAARKNEFFAHPVYQEVKTRFYHKAVRDTVIISETDSP
ncbi:MAG TPA: DUF1330 domain-containing protein [Oligoflexus sp.]|uniref:DUF1330 domain-containing protein n=1 Tax=Oligoflexus sp. TaxID=1971216 RepID=UPI002D239C9D|nr:DUF1330 domain-containing protein [Oligoflexus sp.]HYX38891.1 DUF1330 domain-containing protein [Oligoflexus sp.]